MSQALDLPAGGGGLWNVGSQIAMQTTNADVTFTSADLGKTHYFFNNTEVKLTLPDMTSQATGDKVGLYFLGDVVNIYDSTGVLLARFTGSGTTYTGVTAVTSNGSSGCKLSLVAASAAGTWSLVNQRGTMLAPKLVKELDLAGATQDASLGWTLSFRCRFHTNSPGVVPRHSHRNGYVRVVPISESLAAHFCRDSANGTRMRMVTVASDGTMAAGAWTTLSSYTSATDVEFPWVCVLAQASGGYDTFYVDYSNSSTVRAGRIIDVATGTTTISASAQVAWPTTDNNGKTLGGGDANGGQTGHSCVAAGVSSTTAVICSYRQNTTDGVAGSYAWSITRTGSGGSPSLTFGTPQKINTTNTSTPPVMAVLVGNVSNRLFVLSESNAGTTAFGNANNATDSGCVLDVSTVTTPSKAYQISNVNLPYFNGIVVQPWYNTSDNYIYIPTATGSINSYGKFQAGSAALSGQAIAGVVEYRTDYTGTSYGSATILDRWNANTFYPLDGLDVTKGYDVFAIGNLARIDTGANSKASPSWVGIGRSLPLRSGSRVGSYTAAATTDNASLLSSLPLQAALVKELTPTTGSGSAATNGGGCFMRSGRFLIAHVDKTGGTLGVSATTNTALWALEVPRAA